MRLFFPILLFVGWPATALGQSSPSPRANAGSITVGRNVHVSASRPEELHTEVILASDLEDPKHLLACTIFAPKPPSPKLLNVAVYASGDGGATWQETLRVDRGSLTGDPTCTF